jgi:tetratricopeptide (TPR) repeat protein
MRMTASTSEFSGSLALLCARSCLWSLTATALLFGQPIEGQAGRERPSLKPIDAPAQIETARRQIGAGQFRNAETSLHAYLSIHEDSADAHALLGYAEMRLNQPKESLQEFTRAAQLRTPTAQELRSVGDDYALLDDFIDADHWMSRSLSLDRQDPDTWYNLGRIRYSLQRFQDAAHCFEKTLELIPESVKAANNLGLAYEGLNRTDDAVREYHWAIAWQASSVHPSEQPLLNLAIILIHQNKGAEALPLLTQAVKIAPANPQIHDQLGHLFLNRGALLEAQAQFEEAISLVPQSGAYHFLLGQVYRRRGLSAEAKKQFELAAAADGNHSSPE